MSLLINDTILYIEDLENTIESLLELMNEFSNFTTSPTFLFTIGRALSSGLRLLIHKTRWVDKVLSDPSKSQPGLQFIWEEGRETELIPAVCHKMNMQIICKTCRRVGSQWSLQFWSLYNQAWAGRAGAFTEHRLSVRPLTDGPRQNGPPYSIDSSQLTCWK